MTQWVKWILGIVAALTVASVAGAGAKLSDHGERLTKTETQFDYLQQGQQRIEDKLDRVVERLYQRHE